MAIEIKELKRFEITDEMGRLERAMVSGFLATHQHELKPTLLQYLSKYNPKIKTEEDAANAFVNGISKNPKSRKMIYALEPKSALVVGVLYYEPRLNEVYIKHMLKYYPENFTSPEQLANKTILEYLIIHKEFRSEGIGKKLEEEMIINIKNTVNTDGIIVKTQSSNIKAQEFYKKIGYSQIGEVVFPDKFRAEHGCPDEGSIWFGKQI